MTEPEPTAWHSTTVTTDDAGEMVVTEDPPRNDEAFLLSAADLAPKVLGEYIGDAVACVLGDHSRDEFPDPNVHELAQRVLVLQGLNNVAGA